jgi:glycosyltransferase involved in cell wall biosynthesis
MALIWIVEKAGSHLSDWIVTRGTYHKELLATWNLENVTVIPDGVETSVEVPRDGKAVRERLGLVGKVVIGMIGSMDWSERDKQCYGWDVVEVLAHLRDLPVAVLMVGDGSGRPILEARVAELGVTSLVHFVGRLPYEELAEYLGAMDICVSTQSNNLVGMVRTTGKLPLYLAHDKFIIATNVGEARRVLPEVGILLPFEGARDPAHPERLAATIRALVAEPARFRLGGAARKVAIEEFEYTVLGARLQDVIERAATGRRRGVPVTQGLVTEQGKQ